MDRLGVGEDGYCGWDGRSINSAAVSHSEVCYVSGGGR